MIRLFMLIAVAQAEFIYTSVDDFKSKCTSHHCLVYFSNPREPQSLEFQKQLEANHRQIQKLDPTMNMVIAGFAFRAPQQHLMLPHVQHPYVELYHHGRLATWIANIKSLNQLKDEIIFYIEDLHRKHYCPHQSVIYQLHSEDQLLNYLDHAVVALPTIDLAQQIKESFLNEGLIIFVNRTLTPVLLVRSNRISLKDLTYQDIHDKIKANIHHLDPSNPHFYDHLRHLERSYYLTVSDNREERSKAKSDIVCSSEDCESLIYQLGLEHLRVPFLAFIDGRNRYISTDLDFEKFQNTTPKQPYIFQRTSTGLLGSLLPGDYSHFNTTTSNRVLIDDLDELEYQQIMQSKSKNYVIIYTNGRKNKQANQLLRNLVRYLQQTYQIDLHLGRVNVRHFNPHVYVPEESDILYQLYTPLNRYQPVGMELQKVNYNHLYYILLQNLGESLSSTTGYLLEQAIHPTEFDHNKPRHELVLYAIGFKESTKAHIPSASITHDDL